MVSNPSFAQRSVLSSATADTLIASPVLGTAILLVQIKKPTELDNFKVCYKRYYKHVC